MFLMNLILFYYFTIFLFKINMIISTKQSHEGIITISKYEWLEKLNKTKVSKEDLNKL